MNEAFERIPEEVERRLLRDRIWLEYVWRPLAQKGHPPDTETAHRPGEGADLGRDHERHHSEHGGQHAPAVLHPGGVA